MLTLQQCQTYLEEKTGDRLRATELLGKSQGDFIERVELMNLNSMLFHRVDTIN